jgi:hypothetical protein
MSSRRLLRILSLFQPRSHRSNPLLLPMPRREHSQPKRVSTVGQPAWCRRTGREVEVDATCARHARTPRNRLRIEGRNQEASPHRAMTATIWPDVQETHPRDAKGLDSRPFLPCPETYPLWDNRTPHSVMIVISSLQLEAVFLTDPQLSRKQRGGVEFEQPGTDLPTTSAWCVLCAFLQNLMRVRSNRRT